MSRVILAGKEISAKLSESIKTAITGLNEGQVLAVYMKNVSTDESKVQVEFAEKINLSNAPTNALAMFNPGDDRFSSGARRVWVLMDRKFANEMFGLEIPEEEAFIEINKVMKSFNGSDFRIRITEKLESQLTAEEKEYKNNYLKTIPSTGAFFIAKESGERVASSTSLVLVPRKDGVMGDPQHVLIEGEYKVEGIQSTLGNVASKETSKTFVS